MKWLCGLADKKKRGKKKRKKAAEGTCLIKCEVHCYTSLVFPARRPLNVNCEKGSSFNSKKLICSVLSLLLLLLLQLFILILCCVISRSRCAQIMPPNFLLPAGFPQKKKKEGAKWPPLSLIPAASVISSSPQENVTSSPLRLKKSLVWYFLRAQADMLLTKNGSNYSSRWKLWHFPRGHALRRPLPVLFRRPDTPHPPPHPPLAQARLPHNPHNPTKHPDHRHHT